MDQCLLIHLLVHRYLFFEVISVAVGEDRIPQEYIIEGEKRAYT